MKFNFIAFMLLSFPREWPRARSQSFPASIVYAYTIYAPTTYNYTTQLYTWLWLLCECEVTTTTIILIKNTKKSWHNHLEHSKNYLESLYLPVLALIVFKVSISFYQKGPSEFLVQFTRTTCNFFNSTVSTASAYCQKFLATLRMVITQETDPFSHTFY